VQEGRNAGNKGDGLRTYHGAEVQGLDEGDVVKKPEVVVITTEVSRREEQEATAVAESITQATGSLAPVTKRTGVVTSTMPSTTWEPGKSHP
jgi:hypothetical protein